MRNLLLTAVSMFGLVHGSTASAQSLPTTPPPPSEPAAQAASQADQSGVTDIVVTAQRIAQPLQRVPVSVQAVTGADLEKRKLNDVVEMQIAVPSLSVGITNSVSLRGVGSLTYSPNVDSSVGVSVDDVSLGVPVFMNYFSFEDVERVEVLNGPQGLLFGRNASAGLVNIITKRPVLGRFEGRAYVESDYRDSTPGGGFGQIARATVNIPLGSTTALRLNGIFSNQDSIATVVARGPRAKDDDYQRRLGLKGKFLFAPNDRFSIYLTGDYAQNRGIGGVLDTTARTIGAGSILTPALARDGIVAGPTNLKLGYSAPFGGVRLDTGGASAEIAWKISDAIKISNIFAWRAFKTFIVGDIDATSSDGVDANIRRGRYRQYSNELRMAIDAGPVLDGQLGVYAFDSVLRTDNSVGAAAFGVLDPLLAPLVGPSNSVTNPYLGLDLNSRVHSNSLAGFGQFNVHPVDRVTLILGGRLTRDSNFIRIDQNKRFYPIPLGAVNYSGRERVRNTDFSWKLGGQYDLGPAGMLYATYSKGYKGPAFNESAAVANQRLAIGPETVHAAEIGAKTTLFDRKLRLNLSAFREDFDNFQVQGFDARTTSYYTANAARVRSQGIELTTEARPVRALTLNAAATLLDSKFRGFPNDRCYPGQVPCAANGSANSSGNRTPSSAKFTSTVGFSYEKPVMSDATVALSGNWYHRSSVNFSSNANPATHLDGIDTFDLSLSAKIHNEFTLSVFCKNCTNKIYPVFIGLDALDGALANANSTQQTWGYNSVRTIGISANANF